MHPPSLQLLRALRNTLQHNRTLTSHQPLRLGLQPSCRSYSSDHTGIAPHRPSRVAPRFQPAKPRTRDRGPRSEEKTQTDFAELNVFGNIPTPATAVDACLDNGFHLDNGVKVTNGDGVLLVAGEAFAWRPWQMLKKGTNDPKRSMINEKGQFELPEEAWGLLSLVWPRPGKSSNACTKHNSVVFYSADVHSF